LKKKRKNKIEKKIGKNKEFVSRET
jgi:hypothetical protein